MGLLDGWRFCPRCAEPLARGEGSVECSGCGARFRPNPVTATLAEILGLSRVRREVA